MFSCRKCGRTFTQRNNMYRHEKHRCKMNKLEEVTPDTPSITTSPKVNQRIPVKVRKKTVVNNYYDQRQQIVINFNINLGQGDIYEQLKLRLGEHEADRFLASIAAKNKLIDVIQKMYLENVKPDKYPIASDGKRFRYIENGRVVEDSQGHIVKRLTDDVQKALISATTNLINTNLSNNTVDQLYDVYDLASIKHNILMLDHQALEQQLNQLVYNPDHDLFKLSL